jgi:tetratricopeptide (TPR) repeat protein
MAACNRALRLDPSYAEAYRIRGVAQYHRADFDQAIVDLNSAIYLDPSLSDGVAPFLTAAREKGGMDPAVRSQALARIQRDSETVLTRQTPAGPREQWLLDLMAMPNTTEQISHFKQLVSSTPRTEPDHLNWLADFLMVDRGLPAAKFLKSYLQREPMESESISAVELALRESIESASTAAADKVNLFADTIAYAIHYQFNSLLADCIDTGACRPKLNHLYQAIEQPEAASLNTLLPQAVLLDREVEGLLDQAMELDRKSHVQLLIQKYRESLTGTVLEYLERPERNR